MEAMKKENIQLKEQINITKDDHEVTEIKEVKEVQRVNIYKNYIPLCLIGVVGLGIYMYKSKQVAPIIQRSETSSAKFEKKEIDPFEFN
jgi:hypothetical protein